MGVGWVGVGGCAAGLASMDVYSAINAVAWESIGNAKMIFSIIVKCYGQLNAFQATEQLAAC